MKTRGKKPNKYPLIVVAKESIKLTFDFSSPLGCVLKGKVFSNSFQNGFKMFRSFEDQGLFVL